LSLELATPITPGFEALVFKAARGIEDIYELTYIRKDGSRFPAVVSVTALRDDQNAIIGYLLIGTDNTARKQAEEALLKAGALQNAIFNSANFSSIATDEKGVIQIFNVGAERMLGYAAAEVMNKITPADISDPQEVITRAKALSAELGTTITPGFEALVFKASRGIEDIYELTYIRKDGSRFPAIVSVTALRDAQGGIIGYLLIGTDNTARKQVEAERMLLDQRVRDQQFYTRSLIESNIDALIATDPRGIITDVNKQMEALTGCTRDELIGAPFKDYFTNPERAEAGIKLVLGEGKVIDYELTARARDGKETVVSYSATTFHDRDRKLQGVFAAARDVTERKRYEQSLRLADQRKDEFLAMLAHELRNPLAPIRNSLEILSMPGVDAETAARTREMMGRQVQNLVRLVDDLLDVSRVMQGKIEQRREHVDLGSIVACAIETVQPLMEAQGHELTVTLPSKPLFLDADPVRLAQVVGNLLTNAAKYTEAKGRIALIATREGNEAVLRLQDNGIGIAADILPRIFELFVQVDHAATRSQGGLGIGLTLVKNLVEMHQGSIEAHSDGLGTGSEFVMRLPLSKDEGGRMKDESETEPIHPSSFILHPSKRLLVIDDNQDAANSLAMLLRMQGYEVRVAHSGAEALALTRSYTPQVVFLDIGMPGMDGYEVARKLRLQPGLHSVVLAAVTGWGQEEDRRRTTEAGFDHHLVKPPEPKAVQHVLAALGK
jgi:PAS domain S-box-containing protein